MKTFILFLFPILGMAQHTGIFLTPQSPFWTKTEAGKTTIIFSRSSPYTRVEWTTLTKGEYFSDIHALDLSRNRFIKVEYVAIFWLIGTDTMSVVVVSPITDGYLESVYVNGKTEDQRQLKKSLWSYYSLVPEITAYYEEYYSTGGEDF